MVSSQTQLPGAGYKVGTITVKFVGTANVNEQVVRANMQLHEGGDLDDTILDRDIRTLYRTGLFEFIQTKWEVADPHTFNLVVEVTPKYRVLAVHYEGNKSVKSGRLSEEVKTKPNTALDERQVKEDSEKIKTYYQKKGFNQAAVTYRIDKDRSTGLGTVVFQVEEGAKVRIANVLFIGNARIKSKKLRSEIDTRRWWIFSWLTDSGRFEDDQFQDDLTTLREYYQNHGFLNVDIPGDKVTFDYPTPGRMIITITISEGRQYKIGEITFIGNKVHSSALLRRVARQKTGMVFSPSKIDKDVSRLEDFYGKDGYLNNVDNGTRVHVVRKPNLATSNIDLEYHVEEGQRFNVESIVIEGNTKTKSTVILRELTLGPGDVFNTVLVKISKLRLENTRYFDDVDIEPQDTNIPGREDLRVSLREGHTGQLTFGAGYSTLAGADMFVEVEQTNFDLFNSRSLFVGDGQKFRVRVEIGQLSNSSLISFEEPWLFQKQLDLTVSVFRTGIDYESAFYNEVDLGASISIRKRLFELIDAQLGYTYENIEIRDVTSSASALILDSEGNNAESKGNLMLSRDTRDKLINTTSGNFLSINTTVAGGPFGGKNNYYRFDFDGAQYFPIFDTQAQVLTLITHDSVIQNFGASTTVPYYDALYLGGPDDLRGFDYRQVSPRDQVGEPIGGKTSAFLSAEYSFDIISPIRGAFFYDAGFVNPGAYDFNAANFQDNWGVGLRMYILGAPMRIDYGYPIRGDFFYPNKQGGQFNFSFGTRF